MRNTPNSCHKNINTAKQATTTRLSSIRNRRTRLRMYSIDNMKSTPPLCIQLQLSELQGY